MLRAFKRIITYFKLVKRYRTLFGVFKLRNIHSREVRKRKKKRIKSIAGKCRNCGTTNNLTIDHIIPRSKGGTSRYENLQVLCGKCNVKKADKIMVF